MVKRQIITTADGSKTIHLKDWNEHYHSVHGAIQEAKHVYINHGLLFFCSENKSLKRQPISILEMGFGTGLNAILTLLKAQELRQTIHYVGVEAFPITSDEVQELNYPSELKLKVDSFHMLHECSWEDTHQISDHFQLTKQQKFFKDISEENTYDVIYFDAFGARVQPELWTEEIFKLMYNALKPNGVLTTYAAIGSVRRLLKALGFDVERLQGPPGKRHMLRAIKR